MIPGADARPTNSQLRWACAHAKPRARYTRSVVAALMESPATEDMVPGFIEGDGDGGGVDDGLSRGRRALLRTSQRNYEERRKDNLKRGYRKSREGAVAARVKAAEEEFASPAPKVQQLPSSSPPLHGAPSALAEAFGEEFGGPSPTAVPLPTSASSRPVVNRGRQVTESTARFTEELNNDNERVRRFENAMTFLKGNTPGEAGGQAATAGRAPTSGKRWTRPEQVQVYAGAAAGDSPYYDIQRGGSFRVGPTATTPKAEGVLTAERNGLLVDRGASWRVHVPEPKGSAYRGDDLRAAAGVIPKDRGASWLVHVPRAEPQFTVGRGGKLISSPAGMGRKPFSSPELQDKMSSWSTYAPRVERGSAGQTASTRQLKVDIEAEAVGANEKSFEVVLSPGQAKFHEIISQYQSIEAMVAAERELEVNPPAYQGEVWKRTEPVTGPTMSMAQFIQKQKMFTGTPSRKRFKKPTAPPKRTEHPRAAGASPSVQDQGEGLTKSAEFARAEFKAISSGKKSYEYALAVAQKSHAMRFGAAPDGDSNSKIGRVKPSLELESFTAKEARRQAQEISFEVEEPPTPNYLEYEKMRRGAVTGAKVAGVAAAGVAVAGVGLAGVAAAVAGAAVAGAAKKTQGADFSRIRSFFSPGAKGADDDEASLCESDEEEARVGTIPANVFAEPTRRTGMEPGSHVKEEVKESQSAAHRQQHSNTFIDTDNTTSDISESNDEELMKLRMGSLMLSPTVITQRYQQAVAAIEARNWDQVTYIINANPWLAEMSDLRNNQYLLHKLALYGAGDGPEDDESLTSGRSASAAPEELSINLMEKFPGAVHKFDNEGNLPLHMAATSGNLTMIRQMGEVFKTGASVQNNEGLLPLHLAVLSCAYPSGAGGSSSPSGVVKAVIDLFPGGVGRVDSDGNLPLHIAAANLSGDLGVDIMFLLLDEAEMHGNKLRIARDTRIESKRNMDHPTYDAEEKEDESETPFCNLVKNKQGDTPLRVAIQTYAGWQIIEMLIQAGGGQQAVLEPDDDMKNALHLLVQGPYADPAAIMSLLKFMPSIAAIPDGDGVLPIEAACMASMPRSVILALVLVDLPIDLDDKDAVNVREGFGASWSFLTCDCDDAHPDMVEEVLSICSYRQIRELCFLLSGPSRNAGTVITQATPKSKAALRNALRFVGRYEFTGSSPVHLDADLGLKVFEALDFGTGSDPDPAANGREVLLSCYSEEGPYLQEIASVQGIRFDHSYIERIGHFCTHDFEAYFSADAPAQFCISVEKMGLSLSRVVASSGDYRTDPRRFHKYLTRVSMVLRLVGKALRHIHSRGLVHGNLTLQNCGKYGDKWKLAGIMNSRQVGSELPTHLMGESVPPEATVFPSGRKDAASARLRDTVAASPALDVWGFGKLLYETLVGDPLIPFDYKAEVFYRDQNALVALAAWDDSTLRDVVAEVIESGAGTLAADLISHCLCPSPEDRPQNFDIVLDHPFWKDQINRKKNADAWEKKQKK